MPRITKASIGWFIDNELVGLMTLGYGVRPKHTINILFPSLDVCDYFELGKLCMRDEMPKNSESMFISKCIKFIKSNFPEKLILFSWADGIIGKPGYVYQASNFYYGGYIWTEMYIDENGTRIHPRTFQGISTVKSSGKMNSRAFAVAEAMNIKKYYGLQFRYVYPLCNKWKWKELQDESPFKWTKKYPKDVDCKWRRQIAKGKREDCGMPPFKITNYVNKQNSQPSLFFE